jgi:hypothetical protein
MDGFVKKSSTKIQEAVKAAGKRAKEEVEEIAQHTSKQIIGGEDNVHTGVPKQEEPSPVTEAMQQTTQPALSEDEKKKLNLQFIDRTKKLEEEIEKYRKQRNEENRQRWSGSQSSRPVGPGEPMYKPLEIPKSKPARGKMPGAPGTAKGETGPEVRKSKQ